MEFSLAHLSDPHLPPPPAGLAWQGLRPKQLLALLSWRHKRRRIHTWQPAAALLADLRRQAPNHIAVTGDLINLAAPAEFAAGADWLAQFGPADDLSYVPGNHDLTAATPWGSGLGLWSAWMGNGSGPDDLFPYLRKRGPVAVIGLSSAIVTPVGSAAGALGPAQLDRLAVMLDETGAEDLFRVVLVHHPPVIGPGGQRKALRDRAALCAVLRRHGTELLLHGHHHQTRLTTVPGPTGPIPVFGVPAALAGEPNPELAGWHLHRIAREPGGWRLTTILRHYDKALDRFTNAGQWTIRQV